MTAPVAARPAARIVVDPPVRNPAVCLPAEAPRPFPCAPRLAADPASRPTVLVVDDRPEILTVLGELLHGEFRVRVANSGYRALALVAEFPVPDLILLDVMMPAMSGYDVLAQLRANPLTRDVPVLFLTAADSAEAQEQGLMAGAVDYITKPLRPAIVLARVRTHLAFKSARDRLREENASLEAEVARRVTENHVAQDVTIHALARLAETRDSETGNHLLRTQAYVRALGRRLQQHPRIGRVLTDQAIDLMAKSAPLHDIGKVGIPDSILLKPGRLSADEWAVMKTHPRLGAEAIERAERDTEHPIPFLEFAKEIALRHHEHWDGSGYPDGLAGEAIPLSARLMTIGDVFDALISHRVYKAAIPPEEARAIMLAERGRQFDPDIIDAFVGGFEEFCAIAHRYADAEPPPGRGVESLAA